MTDEIGRREFLKRGTVAGVIASTGFSMPHALASPQVAPMAAPHVDAAAPQQLHDSSKSGYALR